MKLHYASPSKHYSKRQKVTKITKAALVTYGDNDEEKKRKLAKYRQQQLEYVNKLNTLYYSQPPTISGDELMNIVEMKFGKLHKPGIVVKENQKFLCVYSEVQQSPDMIHFNKLAEEINVYSDPNYVKSMISNITIQIEDNKDILIEFPLQ